MAIPIEQSFLYVEPVYLQASQESKPQTESGYRTRRTATAPLPALTASIALPELKRVIVAYGNEVVMKENLASALAAVFKEGVSPREVMPKEAIEEKTIQDLASAVLDQYRTAQNYLKAGDWAGYGQALEKMERMLRELAGTAESTSSER